MQSTAQPPPVPFLQSRFPRRPVKGISVFHLIIFVLWLSILVILAFHLPDAYSSSARLYLEVGTTNLTSDFYGTEMDLMRSPIVLEKVIDDLDLRRIWGIKYFDGEWLKTTNAIILLQNRLVGVPIGKSSTFEITCFSEDPKEAADLANAVAKSYIDFSHSLEAHVIAVRLNLPQTPVAVITAPAPVPDRPMPGAVRTIMTEWLYQAVLYTGLAWVLTVVGWPGLIKFCDLHFLGRPENVRSRRSAAQTTSPVNQLGADDQQ